MCIRWLNFFAGLKGQAYYRLCQYIIEWYVCFTRFLCSKSLENRIRQLAILHTTPYTVYCLVNSHTTQQQANFFPFYQLISKDKMSRMRSNSNIDQPRQKNQNPIILSAYFIQNICHNHRPSSSMHPRTYSSASRPLEELACG